METSDTRQVAETVKSEASNVAGEASTQLRSLAGRASGELRNQLDQRRTRASGALRTTADEFASLADKGEHSTLTSELTKRAAEQARRVADYVEHTEPADVANQVRSFARRRPAVFLLAAALAGVVTGRLVKSAMTSSEQPERFDSASDYPASYAGSGYSEPGYTGSGYTGGYRESGYPESVGTPPAATTIVDERGMAPGYVAEPGVVTEPGVTETGTTRRGDRA